MNNYCVHNLYEKVWLTLIDHPSMTSIKFIEKISESRNIILFYLLMYRRSIMHQKLRALIL